MTPRSWLGLNLERPEAPHIGPAAWSQVHAELWGQLITWRAYLTGRNGLVAIAKLNCHFAYELLHKPIKKCQAVSSWLSFPLSALKSLGEKRKALSILYSWFYINRHTQHAFRQPLWLHDPLQAQDQSAGSKWKGKEGCGLVPQMLCHVWNGWTALPLGCLLLVFSKKKKKSQGHPRLL